MDIYLKPWDLSMTEEMAKLADNPNIAKNLTDGFPYPYILEDAESYIQSCMEQDGKTQLCRAIFIDGHPVGSIGVFFQKDVFRKTAELGYWLGEPYWGKGIMPKAIQMLCQTVFEKYDIVRIQARPFSFNKASCRVLEKAGFSREAVLKNSVYKNNQIHDSIIYAIFNT